jgi:addiction module HigA family antidote
MMTTQKLPPVHPGEILLEEYLKPLGISQNKLGRDLNVPAQRINEIVRGQRAITVDTALRLARYFHTSPQFWLNLQSHYDLEIAQETRLAERVIKEVREREGLGLIIHREQPSLSLPPGKASRWFDTLDFPQGWEETRAGGP